MVDGDRPLGGERPAGARELARAARARGSELRAIRAAAGGCWSWARSSPTAGGRGQARIETMLALGRRLRRGRDLLALFGDAWRRAARPLTMRAAARPRAAAYAVSTGVSASHREKQRQPNSRAARAWSQKPKQSRHPSCSARQAQHQVKSKRCSGVGGEHGHLAREVGAAGAAAHAHALDRGAPGCAWKSCVSTRSTFTRGA